MLYVGFVNGSKVKPGLTKAGKPFVGFSVSITTDRIGASGYAERDFVRAVAWDNNEKILEYLDKPENPILIDGEYGDKPWTNNEGEAKTSKEFLGDYAIYIPGYNNLGEPVLVHVSGRRPQANAPQKEIDPPAKGVTMPPPEAASVGNPMPIDKAIEDRMMAMIDEEDGQADARFEALSELKKLWFPQHKAQFFEILTTSQAEYITRHLNSEIMPAMESGVLPESREEMILRVKGLAAAYIEHGGKGVPKLRKHLTLLDGKFDEILPQLTDWQIYGALAAFKYLTPVAA